MAQSASEGSRDFSRRSEKPGGASSVVSTGSADPVSLPDSGNSEIGRQVLGISQHPATITAAANTISWMMAAGDQIVLESGITPITFWRKCPGVATSNGALADKPNCQSACAAVVTASRNGKSI